jgi:ribosomal protein S18 acetylase RimI-like enzyme
MEPEPITIRPLAIADYDAVVALWQQAEGVEVAEGDGREDIAGYLQRNPGLSRVAQRDGQIVGAVLCGHDGRRGLIYHLAVAKECRGRGLGRQLVSECMEGLRACGIKRAILLAAKDNTGGREFWLSTGFEEIEGAQALGMDI